MEESSSNEQKEGDKYFLFYLPHQALLRPETKTTKVRVVFNASKKHNNGIALNDVLHTGPVLQTDFNKAVDCIIFPETEIRQQKWFYENGSFIITFGKFCCVAG